MLEVRRLHLLADVARHGSITAAAQACSYSPSAVSQQILVLEREVGVRVLERGARGVTLTEPGRLLVRHAEDIAARLAAAEAELKALAGLDAGLLRLGWFATAGSILMPDAIATFHARHPEVELTLIEADPDECVARLRTGELELGLVYEFDLEPPLAEDLKQVALLEDPASIALPVGHRLARRRQVKLGDLAGERWIQGVHRGPTVEVLPRACRLAGFEPLIGFRTDDHMAVQGLVAAGVGIALVPQLTVPTARPDIVVRPLLGDGLSRQVRVALPAASYRSPAASAMLGILQEVSRRVQHEAEARLRDGRGAKA